MYLFKYKLVGDTDESEIRSTMGDELRVEKKFGPIKWETEEITDENGETKTVVSALDTDSGSFFERQMYTVFVAFCRSGIIDGKFDDPDVWEHFLNVIDYIQRDFSDGEDKDAEDDRFEDEVLDPTGTDSRE